MSEQVKPQLVWLPDGLGGGEHVHVYRATDYDALHAEAEALRADQFGVCMMVAEAAIKWARGRDRAVSAEECRQIVQSILTATPAPEVQVEPPILQDEAFADEFAAWWESDGQYVRSGGGDYERTFAFEAWRYLMPKVRAALAEQGERQEAVAEVVRREPYEDGTPNPCKTLVWSLDNCEDDLPAGTKLYTTPQPGPDVRALVEALEEIEDPIRFMRARLQDGEQLNGVYAIQLADSGSYLRGIATRTLAAHRQAQRQA